MAKVALDKDTITAIEDGVATYTEMTKERIPVALTDMVINMLVSKYVAIRRFPNYEDDEISEDVNAYFKENVERIAFKIPSIVARMGTEGETQASDNGMSTTYANGDPLYDAFPDVVQLAKVL